MKREIFRLALFLFVCAALSCGDQNGGLSDIAGDDTDQAVKLVVEANKDLREIKKLYKENDGKVEDIKIAMKELKVIEVRKLAREAGEAIDKGIRLGDRAIGKIEEATRLDINENFEKYLRLKEQSLRKLVEAFEIRRELATALGKEFILSDRQRIDELKAQLMEKEKEFHRVIKEGQDKSREANKLAKDLARRVGEDEF